MPGPIRSLHYVVIAVAALVIALAMATETAGAQTSRTCALTQGAPSIAGSLAASAIPNHIVEQYKAYLTDLGNIGSRFGTVQVFYLTIVAALIGVLSLKDTNRSVQNFLSPVSVVVFLFIAVICWLWWDTLDFYGKLFAQKFDVLRAIEKQGGLLDVWALDECYHGLHLGQRRLIRTESHFVIAVGAAALVFAIIALVFQLPCMRKKLPQLPD
jgi:hypothetical protein